MSPLLELNDVRASGEHLPSATMNFALLPRDFAIVETSDLRLASAFAALLTGFVPLVSGRIRFVGRDWAVVPAQHADALRGQIGQLFPTQLREDTPDVAERIILRRLHHTRLPRADLLAEAATLARRFGLPGLPTGPARLLTEGDLLRAACVRAFLGKPTLVILNLPRAAQEQDLIAALLAVGAEARGDGAAIVWLTANQRLRDRAIRPSHHLRLDDFGLSPAIRALAPASPPA